MEIQHFGQQSLRAVVHSLLEHCTDSAACYFRMQEMLLFTFILLLIFVLLLFLTFIVVAQFTQKIVSSDSVFATCNRRKIHCKKPRSHNPVAHTLRYLRYIRDLRQSCTQHRSRFPSSFRLPISHKKERPDSSIFFAISSIFSLFSACNRRRLQQSSSYYFQP